jgi:hypothetical protein
MTANNTFTCAACGGTFEKGWSEEEASAESRGLWGNIDPSKMAVICDDCFSVGRDAAVDEHAQKELMAWRNRFPTCRYDPDADAIFCDSAPR